MNEYDAARIAGEKLRQLISENYDTQEDFALDFGMDLRTVSRYINSGINKVSAIQELAKFFRVKFNDFFADYDE